MEELQLPAPAHTRTPRPPAAGEWRAWVVENWEWAWYLAAAGAVEECPALAQTLSNTSMLDGARRGAAASTR